MNFKFNQECKKSKKNLMTIHKAKKKTGIESNKFKDAQKTAVKPKKLYNQSCVSNKFTKICLYESTTILHANRLEIKKTTRLDLSFNEISYLVRKASKCK